MEILVIVSFFIGLAILAPRFGHDSRDRLASDEDGMAARGFAWGDEADPHAAAPRVAARPARLALPSRMPRWDWRHLQA